ncbi:MAG: hypothetical protein KDA22_15800 [Phycisphaerales bacterium]|nr:hypothetical protein [Phycisphaerales bacterium]
MPVTLPAKDLGRRMLHDFANARYKWLTVALISSMLLAPITKEFAYGVRVIDGLLLFVIVATLRASYRSRARFLVMIVAAALTGALLVVHALVPRLWLAVAFHLPLLYLLATVTALILLDILSTTRVTVDTIAGAICVYMLIGFVFAIVFSLCATLVPDAFLHVSGSKVLMHFHSGGFGNSVYFSFATLTTVGYGDVAPRAEIVRSLAVLEAMAGQLYLTILVARLVGMHISVLAKD